AQYPLTIFDNSFERSTFLPAGCQGKIDTDALAAALGRITGKWRVLAGRLQDSRLFFNLNDWGQTKTWQVTVPLPEDYRTHTFSTSDVPLSTYVTIPLGTSSENNSLTCWHVTHFPPREPGEVPYSCVGFARSHGIFDGIGAASVMRPLSAEMRGEEWDVPPPLSE
ncbi:hypothetical protein DFH07DRAFT_725723, partial [Mycena maculata]